VRRTASGAWAAYAAAGCAFLFAVPSFYWGFGGKLGADTVNREAAGATWETHPWLMATVLVTGMLKVLGGLLALALVRPWGRVLPRRLVLIVGWGGALVLILYGGVQEFAQLLVALGVVEVDAEFDWHAFWWHLFLWSPWFLTWGILLALALWRYQRLGLPQSG
jgi:hypothetical protein